MQRVWAPWRMEYIAAPKDTSKDGCFLCIDEGSDEESLVLLRKPLAFAGFIERGGRGDCSDAYTLPVYLTALPGDF